MSEFPVPPTALILVVLMNNPRDLEIARLLGWYRIPIRSAPKVVAVDYLAFYQTAAFGSEKWQIQWIAPVNGYELTTRAELFKDEPNHPRANQEYYKIQIGQFVKLPQPIGAVGWKRITFLYTTGQYLAGARRIDDLVVETNERQILWRALRERENQVEKYHAIPHDEEIALDPAILATLLGITHKP